MSETKQTDRKDEAAGERPANPNLETIRLKITGGRLSLKVDTQASGQAYFVRGVRKSGSTMLGNVMNFLARRQGVNIVDLPGTAFRNGYVVSHWEGADLSSIVYPGNVYTGFRNFASGFALSPHFSLARKVFMFRDPRDALVSQYYSDAYTHSLPPEGAEGHKIFLEKRAQALETPIDEYVLMRANGMKKTMMAYQPLLDDPTCLCLRYEEHVFQKKRMIHKILTHFGWEMHPALVENLLEKVDIVPDKENQQSFVRKAVPGDHRVKLDKATIRKLDHRLGDVLEAFDYY